MDQSFLFALLAYVTCGAVTGFLGGMLGIGGGVVIVALLVMVLPTQGVGPEHLYHIAVGTSLASIILTSLSSARAQYRRGAVRMDVLKRITPGILLGTFVGAMVASYMPSQFLQIFIICFLYFVGFNLLFNFFRPKAERGIPGPVGTSAVGSFIGLMSSWVGVGGGTLSTPFMLYCGVPMHTAVGTASAIGIPIAMAGALGYVIGGWNMPGLPPETVGYVHVIAFLGIASFSFLFAPLGVRASHAMPVKTLKRVFALFILLVATDMLWDFASPVLFTTSGS